jgi:hypothetical protein
MVSIPLLESPIEDPRRFDRGVGIQGELMKNTSALRRYARHFVQLGMIVTALAIPTTAFAANTHHLPRTTSSATLTAPASVTVKTSFHVGGTGYNPSEQTWVDVYTAATGHLWLSAGVDANGTLSFDTTIWSVGTATLSSYQVDASGHSSHAASTTVNVTK